MLMGIIYLPRYTMYWSSNMCMGKLSVSKVASVVYDQYFLFIVFIEKSIVFALFLLLIFSL